ncbi:DUF3039 domain-containing protein [Rhodococcus sp. NPDC060090]|uniref:DUF3039 domain-containing protein n=1 Tax=Rhodococcus sp. NPDC060090 TaxID=3347056 RepID=UPI0036561244
MASLPRPTLRCLETDLTEEGWATVGHQRLAQKGMTGPPALPLLDHPFIQHVAGKFAELSEDIRRETISGLSDPKFYKAKSGRWRGAVYFDSGGQAWLVASGLRREGDYSDFYREFCSNVRARGPEQYLPTPADFRRLHRETAEAKLLTWETAIHNDTRKALERASACRTASWNLATVDDSATIAKVTVHHETLAPDDEEPEGYGEITVEVEIISWEHNSLIEHAETIVLCAIDPHVTSWKAAHTTSRMYSLSGTAAEIASTTAEALCVDHDHPREPVLNDQAHWAWAHEGRLTQNYIEGRPIKALCGTVFVPTRLPDDMQRCPQCEAVYRALPER